MTGTIPARVASAPTTMVDPSMAAFSTDVTAPKTRPRTSSAVASWNTVSAPANAAAPGSPTAAMTTMPGHAGAGRVPAASG